MSRAPVAGSAVVKRQLTYQILAAFAATLLLFTGMRMIPGTFPESPALAASSEIILARCDRLAGEAVDKLTAKGIDVRSDEWRRERQSAVQACMNDFAKFEWLKKSM